MPVRIQRKRTKGWKMPENAVYVGRPTEWGNPFIVGEPSGHLFNDDGDPTPMIASLTLEQCLEFYRDAVRGVLSPKMYPAGHKWAQDMHAKCGGHPTEIARAFLRGKDLACWCSLECDCHADVLLEIANQ